MNKYIYALSLYLLTQSLVMFSFFDDPTAHSQRDFVIVSLGCDCHPAAYARKHALRDFAFPFDWCLTPFETIYRFIKKDFDGFIKKKHLVPSAERYFSRNLKKFLTQLSLIGVSTYKSWVVDKKNDIIFVHDFPDNQIPIIAKLYKDIAQKYERRIKRFMTLMNGSKHVYFIRYLDVSKNQAFDLHALLKTKFPKLSYTLIVIGNTAEFNTYWGIKSIKNYFLPIHNEEFWEQLFNDIIQGNLNRISIS
ncbi:MAG: hypothetical protein BWY54_00843 [Candidatus Dependentiae bacterium ADurb.Bin331]|nr:MAG: hypothetical protein BWY54_00843 [Candidatus Dependentiae bacterium ADurb.Bin331]